MNALAGRLTLAARWTMDRLRHCATESCHCSRLRLGDALNRKKMAVCLKERADIVPAIADHPMPLEHLIRMRIM